MSNFWVRTIWGAVFVAVVVFSLLQGFWGQWILTLVISSFCMKELLQLRSASSLFSFCTAWVLNGLLLCMHPAVAEWLGLVWTGNEFALFLLAQCMLLLLIYFGIQLFLKGTALFDEVSALVFGLVYISVPSLLFLHVSGTNYQWQLPLLVFVLTWCSDTFAYLTGRAFGKHKLFETLSPKKTVEGFIGGTVLTAAAGSFLGNVWNLGVWQLAVLGALVSVAGTAGDLFESALKRQAGIKDSGRFIPGHGGALDRFDAFLFVSVVVYSWSIFR